MSSKFRFNTIESNIFNQFKSYSRSNIIGRGQSVRQKPLVTVHLIQSLVQIGWIRVQIHSCTVHCVPRYLEDKLSTATWSRTVTLYQGVKGWSSNKTVHCDWSKIWSLWCTVTGLNLVKVVRTNLVSALHPKRTDRDAQRYTKTNLDE